MLLIYTQKITPRIDYVFKHMCTRILGIKIGFTSVIEEFIAHSGPKLSYGKQAMGNELFVQSFGLLQQQGFEDVEVVVKKWNDSPCFFSVSDKSSIPFDIFSAAFYLMSRYEEYLPHVKDELGRFPASQSLAFKEGFLEQPVVDIWAYEFKKVLAQIFPSLVFPKQQMKIHTLVNAQVPFLYTQRGPLRSFVGYCRDLGKFRMKSFWIRTQVLLGFKKDPHAVFEWLVETSKESTHMLSVFFMLGDPLHFRNSFNTRRKKFKSIIKYVGDYKEVGLIASLGASQSLDEIKKEKQRLEEITYRSLQKAMIEEFSLDLPEFYRSLLELEINEEYSMVYPHTVGFRASTCTPFLFYDCDYETKTPLEIQPIVATTLAFQNEDVSLKMEELLRSVNSINGTFSILFDIENFTKTSKNNSWRNLFTMLQTYELNR